MNRANISKVTFQVEMSGIDLENGFDPNSFGLVNLPLLAPSGNSWELSFSCHKCGENVKASSYVIDGLIQLTNFRDIDKLLLKKGEDIEDVNALAKPFDKLIIHNHIRESGFHEYEWRLKGIDEATSKSIARIAEISCSCCLQKYNCSYTSWLGDKGDNKMPPKSDMIYFEQIKSYESPNQA